ncbi:MAG TPA: hypothetical protein VFH24_05605, partial [Gemmatimonadales bacterium]|nr:hypothetical protein [Gemmatimonadales bacterium]
MRGLLLVGISMMAISTLAAQQAATRATRSDGSVVLLFANGTWKPETEAPNSKASGGNYRKPGSATASVDVLKGASVAYDPSKWTLLPSDKPGRRQLNHRDGDGYALIIA